MAPDVLRLQAARRGSTSPRAPAWSSTTTRPTSRSRLRGRLAERRDGAGPRRRRRRRDRGCSRSPRVSGRRRSRSCRPMRRSGWRREAGADHVRPLATARGRTRPRRSPGGGVDLVIDPVGGDRFTDSLRSLTRGRPRRGGRLHRRLDPGGPRQPAAAQQHRGDRRRLGRGRAHAAGARPARSARRSTS